MVAKRKILTSTGNQTLAIQPHSLVTVLTELSWLRFQGSVNVEQNYKVHHFKR